MLLYYMIMSLVLLVPAATWALYSWRPKPVPIEKRKVQPGPRGGYPPIETPVDGYDLESAFRSHVRDCRICRNR